MKPRINYRAERAERSRKKAAKKEARLAKLSPSEEAPEPEAGQQERLSDGSQLHKGHRLSD
jgi:hypothetical protein